MYPTDTKEGSTDWFLFELSSSCIQHIAAKSMLDYHVKTFPCLCGQGVLTLRVWHPDIGRNSSWMRPIQVIIRSLVQTCLPIQLHNYSDSRNRGSHIRGPFFKNCNVTSLKKMYGSSNWWDRGGSTLWMPGALLASEIPIFLTDSAGDEPDLYHWTRLEFGSNEF